MTYKVSEHTRPEDRQFVFEVVNLANGARSSLPEDMQDRPLGVRWPRNVGRYRPASCPVASLALVDFGVKATFGFPSPGTSQCSETVSN